MRNIRNYLTRSFALNFLVNLLVTTLVAITAMSYVEGNDDFSLARGWRVFSSFFGGFWGMMGSLVGICVIIGSIAYALWATDTTHRIVAGSVCFVMLLFVMFLGQQALSNLAVDKLVFLTIFLAVVFLETFVEMWITHNNRVATRRATPVPRDY